MAQNDEALAKYREGKTKLGQLLRERKGLLENLEELIEHARDLSTSDTIVKFDTDRSEDLCSILKTLETRIDSSIAKINAYAEQCGRAPIQVQTIPSETKKPRR